MIISKGTVCYGSITGEYNFYYPDAETVVIALNETTTTEDVNTVASIFAEVKIVGLIMRIAILVLLYRFSVYKECW